MDVITVDTKNEKLESKSRERLSKVIESYNTSSSKYLEVKESSTEVVPKFAKKEQHSSFYAFGLLYKRSFLNLVRNKPLFFSKVSSAILLGLLLGVFAYNLGDDQNGAFDRIGCLSIMLGLTPFMSILSCIVACTFPREKFFLYLGQSERVVYAREHREGMYKSLPFYFAKALSEYPMELISTFMFWTINYWMSGLNPRADRYFISIAVLLLVLYCSQWYGYVFAALFPQLATANLAANVTYTLFGY